MKQGARETTDLGQLEAVPLRTIWEDEAGDFTPWLAHPENLRLLGNALGLELETETEEASVGPFAADILCKDTATDEWVVIENQVEKTDHRHLGQLMEESPWSGARTGMSVADRESRPRT